MSETTMNGATVHAPEPKHLWQAEQKEQQTLQAQAKRATEERAAEFPNLDCLDETEVREWRNTFSELSNYAFRKAAAMGCRKAGKIEAALLHEAACQSIYNRLPDSVKW